MKDYCYRKTAHPRNAIEGQGYEETMVADTLNVFDCCENRTPILVVSEQCPDNDVIALEGNGARPSHMGKGFSEDGTMYTLNTIEQHSICYENCLGISRSCLKGGNGSTGGIPIGDNIMPAMTANGTGAVCYAIENHPADSRVTMDDSGIVQTLSARMGTGGGNVPLVLTGESQ